MSDSLNIVLFSGGRGTESISKALVKHPQFNLSIIVNAYDDGLSTGEARRFVKGMLGPSDVRKNFSYLTPTHQASFRALKEILELRLPLDYNYQQGKDLCLEVSKGELPQEKLLKSPLLEITHQDFLLISTYFKSFSKLLLEREKQEIAFNFSDCSIGNIIFSGCFLYHDRDFNRATKAYGELCHTSARVLNITDGENLVLVGLREDGSYLRDEAAIVAPSDTNIEEVFLLKDYLTTEQEENVQTSLKEHEVAPVMDPESQKAIETADIIIYGPGTQNSSLFPSYMTEGVLESIANNTKAAKIFVSNIIKDHDISKESLSTLISKFQFYISMKGRKNVELDQVISHIFVQEEFSDNTERVPVDFEAGANIQLRKIDWELKKGKHASSVVSDEIIRIAQEKSLAKLENTHHLVSIIVPCLNEERTLEKVLTALSRKNFLEHNLEKEVIVVDGGSTDRSLDIAAKFEDVKLIRLKGSGRGQAYKAGIKAAKGNIITFFPSDDEYTTSDLDRIILPILNGETQFVVGSRSIKCTNISNRIMTVYHGKRIPYLISKYGGSLLSIMMLVLYERYITDTLSSVKAFSKKSFNEMSFNARGVDFDLELLVRFIKSGHYIHEVSVEFSPRLKNHGKKITISDGILSILTILKLAFFSRRKRVHGINQIKQGYDLN